MTVQRKVFFFHVDASKVTKSVGKKSKKVKTKIDFTSLLKKIQAIKFPERYLSDTAGHNVSVHIEPLPKNTTSPIKGFIGRTRQKDIPRAEKMGEIKDLPLLQDQGVFDSSHFVFFPDSGILGFEFNFYAPRSSRLIEYISNKACEDNEHVDFIPILNADATQAVLEFKEIKTISLKVRKDGLTNLANSNKNLSDAFESARKLAPGADDITLELSARGKERFAAPRFLKALASYFSKQTGEDFRKAEVLGRTASDELDIPIDLLADRLVASVTVVQLGNSRSIESESMYTQIIASYKKHKTALTCGEIGDEGSS